MEERIVNILLDIKTDIGELKKGQNRIEGKVSNLDDKVGRLEDDVSELKAGVAGLKIDMSEVKTTVNTLADALLQTSREVKQIKAKKG